MSEQTIFYAWQSDTDNKGNRYFIRDAIKDALKRLRRDESVEECPRLDHDTKGVPGTPSISDSIFEKIEKAAIFIGDVSFVATGKSKKCPNPNVMIELGYALRALTDARVLLVMNSALGEPEELPFDLRHRRFPIEYSLDPGMTDAEADSVQERLVKDLVHGIAAIMQIPEPAESKPKLKLRVSSTRNGKKELAHFRLFNSGPGPIFIEGWHVKADGGFRESFQAKSGKLPVRIEEQNVAEFVVYLPDVESITALGVTDGDGRQICISEHELAVLKHSTVAHRLPKIPSVGPSDEEVRNCSVSVSARVVEVPNLPEGRLEVVFRNDGPVVIPIGRAELAWKYNPSRMMPKGEGKLQVGEIGGSVSLHMQGKRGPVAPGEEVVFDLDADAAGCLVELLRGDVADEDITVEIGTTKSFGWRANMDGINVAVRSFANDILRKMHAS